MVDPKMNRWLDHMVDRHAKGGAPAGSSAANARSSRSGTAASGPAAAVDADPDHPPEETDYDTVNGALTIGSAALSFFEVGACATAGLFTGIAGIVIGIAQYAASIAESAELSQRALADIVRRVSTASANEFVHRHRGGLAESTVTAGALRSPAIEAHMRRDIEGWIVMARNVGTDREQIVQRALRDSLTQTATNMTRQNRTTETAWRHALERAAREQNVPSGAKQAVVERAFADTIAGKRIEVLQAFVERAIQEL